MDRDRDPLVQSGLRNRPQQIAAAADEASKLAPPIGGGGGPTRLFPPQMGPPPPTSVAPTTVPIMAPGQPPLQPPPPQQQQQLRGRRLEETPDARRARARRVCLGALKEIAKTVVLVACLTVYAILGALAFGALEQTNERDSCAANQQLYLRMESDTTTALWNVANDYQKSEYPAAQVDVIEKMVKNFTENVIDIGYSGTDCQLLGKPGGIPFAWNFPGALLFSVTIFTTVGYGNITPKTNWGRMFCIAYAMIGLPLMFFTLANIGEHMAVVFRFVYIKLCCLGLCARRRHAAAAAAASQRPAAGQKQAPWPPNNYNGDDDDDDEEEDDEDEVTIPLTVTLLVIAGYIGLGALVFAVWEGWNAMAAAYFTFVTISTIGLGDLVPGFNNVGGDAQGSLKLLTCAAYMLFGMSLLSMGFDLIQYEMASKMTAIGGQNVGRAGDTVNELQGKEEDEADGVALPARNPQATAAAAAAARAPPLHKPGGPEMAT